MTGAVVSSGNCVLAQLNLTPDAAPESNLGTQVEALTPLVDQIQGGTQHGNNLFHSFSEFNVREGRSVYFENPAGVANILSRVTGNDLSDILGTLGVGAPGALGTANLFLINPSGIIFGPNARLDVGGSFVATTADSVVFDNDFAFSATNPQAPPLLTINVPLGLQFRANPGSIVNQSVEGLEVQPGRTLALVGGDVSLDGGILQARGGQVELGGVAGAEKVGLNVDSNTLHLSFPDDVDRVDVSLANGAEVNVAAGGGGSIAINARNIDVSQGSGLRAGISPLSRSNGTAGDITLNATGTTKIENGFIYNAAIGIGNAGNIRIDTRQLIVRDGVVATVTVSEGNAGDISVNASESVELSKSPSSNGTVRFDIPLKFFDSIPITIPIGLFAASFDASNIADIPDSLALFIPQSGGDAGNLTINTGQLIVRDGAVVSGGTQTTGDAGNLTVKAEDFIELSGTSANNVPLNLQPLTLTSPGPSGLRNGTAGFGRGGDLTIETGRLIVRDGAVVGTNTSGDMPAGVLTVNARESVELSGTSSARGLPSFLASGTRGAGDAQDLTINTQRLIVRDGAIISAGTAGSGRGADLTINASESVELIGTSRQGVSAAVLQQVLGDSGYVLFGIVEDRPFPSGIVTGTVGGTGNAGSLTINTGRLLIQGGAQASVSTLGAGNAGPLIVHASSVELTGTSQQQPNPNNIVGRSLLTTAVGADSTGKGGDITVQANSLTITDGAALTASTSGQREAGNIIVRADTVEVTTGSQVNVSSEGTGNAGNLDVAARSILLDNQGAITATTRSGNGGDITLQARDLLLLRRNSEISTEAGMNQAGGDGGNITIDTDFIVAVPKEDSDIVADAFEGNGGNINITTQGIFGTEFREQRTPESDITASSEFGVDGVVELNTLNVDPSRGLVNLPAVPVDTEVAQGCSAGGSQAQSEFIITGRGGLPPNPSEALSTDAVQVDLVTLNPRIKNRSIPNISTNPTRSTPVPLVEAQGWVRGANGKVLLTANAPTVTPHRSWQRPPECSALQSNPEL
ncbi:S-layer family protein [Trichocoleus sp. FACHB-40]|nr:S-layer family protein [Trichocoleus sp. FACHB-40]MBD2002764.1 S-layer family protein [Trichocoleus sp. FACHB-40]